MENGNLFRDEVRKKSSDKHRRRGPPNRMNDLAYGEWMKFQKSFCPYRDTQALVNECVSFFTKSVWPNGNPSASLVVAEEFDKSKIDKNRQVETIEYDDIDDILKRMKCLCNKGAEYDFILLDLRKVLRSTKDVSFFLKSQSSSFFANLRKCLVEYRYCCLIVEGEIAMNGSFPVAWSVAMSARDSVRLRDEKVMLKESDNTITYLLFFQADDDGQPRRVLLPENINMTKGATEIPAWLIPHPPPRKKNEILHPAKFPETLISDFIGIFTEEGDNVLDPMMGTGSTIVASIDLKRNGYGVDLIKEFVDIARERICDPKQKHLFADMDDRGKGVVLQGDAIKIDNIDEIKGANIDYCVTSPPYWSMLSNSGSENQRKRRKQKLKLVYSDNSDDVGNIEAYDEFLETLISVYNKVANTMKADSVLTVIVKNIKRNHIVHPLAWDLTERLCSSQGKFAYIGTTLWCQDNVGLKPFAVGTHWVSNTLHQYCLHYQKR